MKARKRPTRPPKLRNLSAFVGRLIHKKTKEVKLCDFCKKEPAMWAHETLDGDPVYLCFGCGGH